MFRIIAWFAALIVPLTTLADTSSLVGLLKPATESTSVVYVLKRSPFRLGQQISIYEARFSGEFFGDQPAGQSRVEPFGFSDGKTYVIKGRGFFRHECKPGKRMLYMGNNWNPNDGIPRSVSYSNRLYADLQPGKVYALHIDGANWKLVDATTKPEKFESLRKLLLEESPTLAIEDRKPKLSKRVRRLIEKELGQNKTAKKNQKLFDRVARKDAEAPDKVRYLAPLN